LQETDLSNGEGLEAIGVRISEIPNYTVKNRCFDKCLLISYDNSVTQQYDVSACICVSCKDLEKPEVEIPEMDLYILRDWKVGIDTWFDAGNGAASWNPVPYTCYLTYIDSKLFACNKHVTNCLHHYVTTTSYYSSQMVLFPLGHCCNVHVPRVAYAFTKRSFVMWSLFTEKSVLWLLVYFLSSLHCSVWSLRIRISDNNLFLSYLNEVGLYKSGP